MKRLLRERFQKQSKTIEIYDEPPEAGVAYIQLREGGYVHKSFRMLWKDVDLLIGEARRRGFKKVWGKQK